MSTLSLQSEFVDSQEMLRALYSDHAGALLAYTTRILADSHQAEDVVQETMLRAWRNADRLSRERGSVAGWLTRVARNLALDKIRARNARPTEVEESAATPGVLAEDHSSRVINSVDMSQALTQISPKHREILFQVYYLDRTAAEAASALGIPVGTAKTRIHHGLRRMRAHLEEERNSDTLRVIHGS